MATNAFIAAPTAAVRQDRRWHPGTRVIVAIVLALVSWTPILIAGALLG